MVLTWVKLDKLVGGEGLRFYEGETVTAAGRAERRAEAPEGRGSGEEARRAAAPSLLRNGVTPAYCTHIK